MTRKQEYILGKAKEKINELRMLLDDVMYRTEPLSDSEHKRVRESYDLICKANDKLF